MPVEFWVGIAALCGAFLKGIQWIVRAEVTPLKVRVDGVESDVARHETIIEKLRTAEGA